MLAPMDSVSRATRSRIMAAIRGRDTAPELLVRRALHARGFRFRVDARGLPGRPDLKLTRHGALIFVNGCFWHGHNCARFRAPSGNRGFWAEKIERNRARDLRVVGELRGLGWRVCVVWECALRAPASRAEAEALFDALGAWIRGRQGFLELFDRAAVSGGGPQAGRRGRAFGRSSDAALFAAERQAEYRGLKGPKDPRGGC